MTVTATTNGGPWWIRAVVQVGIGTVIAFMLITWLQQSVDKKLDETLVQTRITAQAQAQANVKMTEFANQQMRQTEIMLLVMRQTCANTAKTESAQDACYVTR